MSRTTSVEVNIQGVLDIHDASKLARGIAELVEDIAGPAAYSVAVIGPYDQSWKEVKLTREVE